ncbi:hypothetical protein B4U79_03976 [Dinothrombium tinctorium]|uniref:SAC domain-containing protein n=1 Tax=Dinothrombium tinctorium TaxID=1965070 RepID=A0A443RS53_9ACAR|nr:hypothetical protein B4U79_03976 [Dinothrombium tinctorium]
MEARHKSGEREAFEMQTPSIKINWVQKFVVYETKARFLVVGSNNTKSRLRVLKIDRTEPRELVIIDDRVEYTHQEIEDLLKRVDYGNRMKNKSASGIIRKIPAYGIFGFVRFLEGYYMILITKRRRIAQMGSHAIYKIEDTCMVYIPHAPEKSNPDESRYLKMFNSVDLKSNFYFSYNYDLTHTLQYNLTPFSETHHKMSSDKTLWESKLEKEVKPQTHGSRTKPNMKFVWNEHMLNCVDIHPDWILYVVHGFVCQGNISVFGRPYLLTLIARRSQKFAGTRFLKRGANCQGDVGNEVETEQILADGGISSFKKGRFTSFVQMRGSIPSHWSQDISKIVPKPTITLDIVDPFHRTAGLHFNRLLSHYGSPVILLNLVKKKEQKPHESVLYNEIVNTISYLNQFLPPKHRIEHIGFDMARMNKRKDVNVMNKLSNIAYYVLKRIGIFQNWPNYLREKLKKSRINLEIGGHQFETGNSIQTGIVRVNCVDCLDRTNTAQFALAKCALAFQFYALGAIEKPVLQFETESVRLLEELYEIHGDTLALQYGGSQLVHRIKTYRKIAPLTSHSRDIMQTLSRYYSNTFSDWEKQNAINLFLGVFKPYENPDIRLWDLSTDYYFHNSRSMGKFERITKPLTQWWDEEVAVCLPRAAIEVFKTCSSKFECIYSSRDDEGESKDEFYEHYKPYELTIFADTLMFQMPHTERENSNISFSPFCVRSSRLNKRKESLNSTNNLLHPNPSLSGNASTSSASSSASELESDYSDDEVSHYCNDLKKEASSSSSSSNNSPMKKAHFDFAISSHIYGTIIEKPALKDQKLYEKYVKIGNIAEGKVETKSYLDLWSDKQNFNITMNSPFEIKEPTVSNQNLKVYEEYIDIGLKGPSKPSNETIKLYKKYADFFQT